jgi:hypothetical protein
MANLQSRALASDEARDYIPASGGFLKLDQYPW